MNDSGRLRRASKVADRTVELLRAERSPLPLVVVAVVVFIVFAVANPSIFPTVTTIQSMGLALPEVGLLGLAVMLSMVIAGIDLSIVGIANLAAVTMGEIYAHSSLGNGGWGAVLVGAVIALIVGAGCGVVNGLVIGRLGITDILATLATGYLFGGLALAWTGGNPLSRLPADLTTLGIRSVGGFPIIFLVFLVAAALVGLLLNLTRFGLRALLLGSNVVAARMSGIRQPRVVLSTYAVSGTLAALAGVIFTARTAAVTSTYGASYLLLAVVIAVLAGVDPNGGFGTALGVVLAAVILQMVETGFTDLNFSQFLYQAAQGLILIGVLAINVKVRAQRRERGRPGVRARAGRAASGPAAPSQAPDSGQPPAHVSEVHE